uniref:C-type lectin domain-containing protein n=1 Tax=Panagrolaimus sp. JU765 TaxID=591449 RepID=A0AC34Q7J2_9BILA
MTNYMGNIAHVTSVHSVAENNYIISLTSAGGTAAFTDFTWLGLFNIGGGFQYTDGSPFNFNVWGTGQPDNPLTEMCVQLVNNPGNALFTVGQWNTIPCTLTQRNYVCKLRAA